jgi:hypothetical protein
MSLKEILNLAFLLLNCFSDGIFLGCYRPVSSPKTRWKGSETIKKVPDANVQERKNA